MKKLLPKTIKIFLLVVFIAILSLLIYLLVFNVDKKKYSTNKYLIKVGNQVTTLNDFNQALEIASTAYDIQDIKNPVIIKNIKDRLLSTIIEEMIILERAHEIKINISDLELEKAVSNTIEDYPEDAFEHTLIEYAISFSQWKKNLKKRLIVEKVIKEELAKNVSISYDELVKYYIKTYNYNQNLNEKKNIDNLISDKNSKTIVSNMRAKKVEDKYKKWIINLKERYNIDINHKEWRKVYG